MASNITSSIKLTKNNEINSLDKYHIIYILFFILGLVHLMPKSFISTANAYWMYKFRNTTTNDSNSQLRTELQADFDASVKIVVQVPEIIFLIATLYFGDLVSARIRLVAVLLVMGAMFIVLTIFVKVNTDFWQEGYFAIVLTITGIINSSNSIFTITMFTMVSRFPQSYLLSYLIGGTMARFFTSGSQIVSLTLGLSIIDGALVYFSVGLFAIVFSTIFLLLTGNNQYYLSHMQNSHGRVESRLKFRDGIKLLRKIWSSVAITGLVLFTSNVAPIALVVSEGEGSGLWNDVYFIPTITYLVPAICDSIGKMISFKYYPELKPTSWVLMTVLQTIILVPLLVLCNAQPRQNLPVLLPHDYQYIIVMLLAGLSAGYLSVRAFVNIKCLVEPEELKDAYHVNMLFNGIQMAATSVLGIVSVKML